MVCRRWYCHLGVVAGRDGSRWRQGKDQFREAVQRTGGVWNPHRTTGGGEDFKVFQVGIVFSVNNNLDFVWCMADFRLDMVSCKGVLRV